MKKLHTYIALLRGINVGGHRKVPMNQLKKDFAQMGFTGVVTLLNSGNVIFTAPLENEQELELRIEKELQNTFGFSIPVMVRMSDTILDLLHNNPFRDVEVTKDIRLYFSFLKENPIKELTLPWKTEDDSYQIIEVRHRTVCSILDLSKTQTTQGMDTLEQLFGKNITTRNLNTLQKIADKTVG